METPAQLEVLRSLQCHPWQGYLYSPPLPIAELEQRLLLPAAVAVS